MYTAFVTTLKDVRKDPNSDRLYLARVFGEGVIVGPDSYEGQLVLYFPTDGRMERWFGDTFSLFRKNADGTPQGGYIEDNGHIKAIKLRGNQSSGVTLPMDKVVTAFPETADWKEGDAHSTIGEKIFCQKYIPRRQGGRGQRFYKGKNISAAQFPDFAEHADTGQLAYNIENLRPGDRLGFSIKMHGTSQRSMKTYRELPRGFFRRLFRMKPKRVPAYVLGTRRTIVEDRERDPFRWAHHDKIQPFVEEGMEVFYEVVGWCDDNTTIMPTGDNKKINDKNFVKEFGPRTVFSYGCLPGESEMYVYRINKNGYEYSSHEIAQWCRRAGVKPVVYLNEDDFVYNDPDQLWDYINKNFEDLHDPTDPRHIKEGIVVRVCNVPMWKAYKAKTYEFKVLEGIIKDSATEADMEEAQEGE